MTEVDSLGEGYEVINKLKKLDEEYLAIERKFEAEERSLKEKFRLRQDPLLKERAKILSKASKTAEFESPIEFLSDAQSGTPALPGFWMEALCNHTFVRETDSIQEWDQPVLDFLKDITTATIDDESHLSFKLDFIFKENPYFVETLLSKTYTLKEPVPWTGEYDVTDIKATKITWKPGYDVTVEEELPTEARPSFFRCFLGANLTQGGKVPAGLLMEETLGDSDDGAAYVDFLMDRDYQLGRSIREDIIPYAVRSYTGEAFADDDDDDSDDDSSEYDDEEDDYDDEDYDYDEDEKPKPVTAHALAYLLNMQSKAKS